MGVKHKRTTLSRKLRQALIESGINQAELSRRTALTTGYIAMLINGERGQKVSAETLIRLAKALDKPISYFLTSETHTGE
jgi:transcriptional regulator with XRE-family HTH domain